MSILYFIIALGVLIFVHEFGHFLVAKKAGIKVEKFSLGFGPKIIGFTRGETEYRISLLPLGGYVKLFGEEPEEGMVLSAHSFSAQSVGTRAAVVGAGPFMNLLLALVLMPVVFFIGRSEPYFLATEPVVAEVVPGSLAAEHGFRTGDKIISVGGQVVTTWEEVLNYQMLHPQTSGFIGIEPPLFGGRETIVGDMLPGGPAEQAGLQAGDQVLKIDGRTLADWGELSSTVAASQGRAQRFTIVREGKSFDVTITPRLEASVERYVIGVSRYEKRRVIQESAGGALLRGTEENIHLIGMTFRFLGRLVIPAGGSPEMMMTVERGGKPVEIRIPYTPLPVYKMLGGPVRIARASGAAARSGLADFIYFVVFLSLQLAVLNVLPIPVLDGGHLAFIGVEAVKGSPLSVKTRSAATQVGFVLLVTLMIFVTVGDVDALWGWADLWHKVRQFF